MQRLKEYIYAGKYKTEQIRTRFFTLLGVLGASIILYGFTLPDPAFRYYLFGSFLLLITAINFKLIYFMALEIILIAGHAAILLSLGPIQQLVLPILMVLQLSIYYLMTAEIKNLFYCIGLVGIALLSIGFAFSNTLVFFLGNVGVAIFSLYKLYKRQYIAIIWGILNLSFALISACSLLNL